MSQQQPPDSATSAYRSEIQVAISTLVASLGFFKVQELTDFIHAIKKVTFLKIGGDFTVVIFPFIGMLLYIGYLFCVAFSLHCIFTDKPPKRHQIAILNAVACYFGLQILMIGLTLTEKPESTSSVKGEILIQSDSLRLRIPLDSVTVNISH
ncbi:hypothetical protein ACWKWU_11115 [Chitinophaga lutea]